MQTAAVAAASHYFKSVLTAWGPAWKCCRSIFRDWAALDLLPEVIASCCHAVHCALHECPSAEMSVQQSTSERSMLWMSHVGRKQATCQFQSVLRWAGCDTAEVEPCTLGSELQLWRLQSRGDQLVLIQLPHRQASISCPEGTICMPAAADIPQVGPSAVPAECLFIQSTAS